MIVSIIVLTYNSSDTIRQTLDSIIDQAALFGNEAEIIVGDDCSSDNTREILTDYKNKYPQLINLVFNSNNLGTVKNYFNLISCCKGKYIMECAGDDYWLPNKMNTQISYMEGHPEVGMCCGNAIRYYEDVDKYGLGLDIVPESVKFESLLFSNCIFAVTVCIRKNTILDYISDVNPIEHNWIMEDYPIWLWISKNSSISYLDTYFCVYRFRMNSISHPNSVNKEIAFLDGTLDIRSFFSENDEDRLIIERRYLLDKSEIYLKYNDVRNYRLMIKKTDCRWKRTKMFLSHLPGYAKFMKLIRRDNIRLFENKELVLITKRK